MMKFGSSSRLDIGKHSLFHAVYSTPFSTIGSSSKYYVYDELRTRAFPCCVRGGAGGACSHQLASSGMLCGPAIRGYSAT